MEGTHGTAHHVRARLPIDLKPSEHLAGVSARPVVAKEAYVSTSSRTCTVGLSPSTICAHEHSSQSKRHRQRGISVVVGHRAVPYIHGTQPDAKVAARSKLWAANNHLCLHDGIRGGTRELDMHQDPQGRPRHGLALRGSGFGQLKVARVQDDMNRPHTSSWHSPLRCSGEASASDQR